MLSLHLKEEVGCMQILLSDLVGPIKVPHAAGEAEEGVEIRKIRCHFRLRRSWDHAETLQATFLGPLRWFELVQESQIATVSEKNKGFFAVFSLRRRRRGGGAAAARFFGREKKCPDLGKK